MGSKIKSFFLGRSNNRNTNLQARPYNAAVASDPPIKGSYPFAGNGPDVLQEIQRARAKRQSIPRGIAPAPTVPRHPQQHSEPRPRTAPHDGTPGGGHITSETAKRTPGRTLSGFSMKSPPSFFSSRRRDSVRSTIDRPPLPPVPASPSTATAASPPPRDIKTYVPTNGNTNPVPKSHQPVAFTPPFAQQHNRTFSQASHKSYVDVLDAHSSIKRTRAASLHRYTASGVRNYGEDVADRNIDAFGERADRDYNLDMNSPEFSYLKSVYSPQKEILGAEPYSRVSSALGHVLGTNVSSRDDNQLSRGYQDQTRANSIYPARLDSAAAAPVSYATGRVRDDRGSTHDNGTVDSRGRAMSPLSSSTASISEDPLVQNYRSRQIVNSIRALSTPPIPERGRSRPMTVTTTTTTTSTTSTTKRNPPPVAPPGKSTFTPYSNRSSAATIAEGASSKIRRRSSSAASQSTVVYPNKNEGTTSRKGSVSFAAFQETPEQAKASRSSAPDPQRHRGMIADGASQPHSRADIVGLKKSADTDVTTKQLPAVVHEHVAPTRHETRREVITGEIHTHDVYHRTLPVIETEILPTKHYINNHSGEILTEIPESMVPKYKVTGRLDQSWHVSTPGPSTLSNDADCETDSRASTDSVPDGPVIGLVRGEPRPRPPGSSKASSIKSYVKREPVLSGKKDYITKDGISRTEYIRRHPPMYETTTGKTQPVYAGAGIGDISEQTYSSDEDDVSGTGFGAPGTPTKGEEELLFRDSGYGSGGMLPGLAEESPSSVRNGGANVGSVVGDWPLSNTEGEATRGLRSTRERRRISATQTTPTEGLENGVRQMGLE